MSLQRMSSNFPRLVEFDSRRTFCIRQLCTTALSSRRVTGYCSCFGWMAGWAWNTVKTTLSVCETLQCLLHHPYETSTFNVLIGVRLDRKQYTGGKLYPNYRFIWERMWTLFSGDISFLSVYGSICLCVYPHKLCHQFTAELLIWLWWNLARIFNVHCRLIMGD